MSKKFKPDEIGSYRQNTAAGGGVTAARSAPLPRLLTPIDDAAIRVIPLAKVLPDPYQSRGGLLPPELMIKVYNQELQPGEALMAWIDSIDRTPLYQKRYDELRDLADSIKQYGLINPIHIYHPPGQVLRYQIESGERRYWAHWLLALDDPDTYGNIRAIVEESFSVYRQIDENEDVSGLTAVGEARNIARAYLAELNIYPPENKVISAEDLYLFFNKVTLPATQLVGRERLPKSFWDKFYTKTEMSRRAVHDRLDVFKLPQRAIELADAANLNLLQIGEILRAEKETILEELTELAALYHLTGAVLRKLARLSIDNEASYQQEVAIIRGQASRQKRKQGTPLEVQSTRIYQAVRGLERLNQQDYQAIAQRIASVDPTSLHEVTVSLERLLTALKAHQKTKF